MIDVGFSGSSLSDMATEVEEKGIFLCLANAPLKC